MALRRNKSGYQVFKENGVDQSVHKRALENKLGRELKGGFEAHHKDGNKDNNCYGNLQEKEKSEHRSDHAKKRSSWF